MIGHPGGKIQGRIVQGRETFQESPKIMLPRLAALLYSALRFSKYRNGGFYSAFKANADNQSIGPQGPQ
jgi:hypothetical protein